MLRLIVDEGRLVAGHLLQVIAERVIPQPVGLALLAGDALTRVGRQYGCDRENDDDYRNRVADMARGQVGDKARYREPGQ